MSYSYVVTTAEIPPERADCKQAEAIVVVSKRKLHNDDFLQRHDKM